MDYPDFSSPPTDRPRHRDAAASPSAEPATFIPSDPDAQVGELFRRLSALGRECPASLQAGVRAALVALGRVAHFEAERRAKLLAERQAPSTTSVRVTAFADRRPAEPFDESGT